MGDDPAAQHRKQRFQIHFAGTLQSNGHPQPSYEVIGQTGPEHRKMFRIQITFAGGPESGFIGEGTSIKRAEQRAAEQALQHLRSSGAGIRVSAMPPVPRRRRRPHADLPTLPVSGRRRHITWMVSLQSLLTTIVIAIFVITFILQAFQIPSGSMENTLLIGDYLLVDKQHFGVPRHLLPNPSL